MDNSSRANINQSNSKILNSNSLFDQDISAIKKSSKKGEDSLVHKLEQIL